MGVGFALSERVEMNGPYILNPSPLDYKMGTSLEMPEVRVVFVDVVDPRGPFGAKEAGEGTVGPTAPAIVNAIYQAKGIKVDSLPITSERMLEALQKL